MLAELLSSPARLAGEETKALVGRPELGNPSKFVIKRVVQGIKSLAREYAAAIDDPSFLRQVARALEREQETVGKRLQAAGSRRG